jgi:hypothetical protein
MLSKKQKGITYIEIVVVLGILGTLIAAIFTLVSTSYQTISFTKARTSALHIAEERMEVLRNMPYMELGTVGGIPAGEIEQTVDVVRNGQKYEVKTDIVFVDDGFDGYSPDDLLPTDYKRARIEVNWGGVASSSRNPIVLVSDISPNGIETSEGGGTLMVTVFNANVEPVSDVEVSIFANLDPQINITMNTDDTGRVILPGAPTCTSCYVITATKDGFNSERTYSTSEVANPAKPHASVREGLLTETSFAMDKTVDLTVYSKGSRANGFPVISNINFRIFGEKTIGTDTEDQPVLKYDQTLSTNSTGLRVIEGLEWGNYWIEIAGTTYALSGTNPHLPTYLAPDTENDLQFSLSPYSINNLLVRFVEGSDIPLASVSARLTKDSYDEVIVSGSSNNPDWGQAFFSNLEIGEYDLESILEGYETQNIKTNVTGETEEIVILNEE